MITAHSDAPDGSVTSLLSYAAGDFPPTAAVLCRNTAPLIAFAFDLLRRGVACHVVGRDIQQGLDRLIEKVGGTSIADFKDRLRSHCDKETEKLFRKGKRQQAENYEDKCAAVAILASQCGTSENPVVAVKHKLAMIFPGDGVTLSTIHRAKGLEWSTVFLLDWNLIPSRYAESAADLQGEKNLQYVAVTRAKLDLKFIRSGNWKP